MDSCLPLTPASLRLPQAARVERLADKSIYLRVREMRAASGGQTAQAGLKPTGLDVAYSDGLVSHYDLEGRLTRVATPNVQWRRGLSQRTVLLRKRPAEQGGGLESRVLEQEVSERVVAEMNDRLRAVFPGCPSTTDHQPRTCDATSPGRAELDAVLARAAAFNAHESRADFERFRSVYGAVPILPPDQYGSLVLLATDGCAYNQCSFCGFYRDQTYRRRTIPEFRSHVRAALAYHGAALAARRGVFLGQANALTGPQDWREDVLRVVNEHFCLAAGNTSAPHRSGICAFIDGFTGAHITRQEYEALRGLHLRRVYFGVETGAAELLAWLKKPATPERMREAVTTAKHGGLHVGVIILVGAGGEPFFDAHVRNTTQLLKSLPLGLGDYIYLSPLTAAPYSEYAQRSAAAGIEPLTAARLAEQVQQLRSAVRGIPRHQRPYVAHYEVTHFVY
jgi:hypothetical protein